MSGLISKTKLHQLKLIVHGNVQNNSIIPYSESFLSSCKTFPLKISLCLSAGMFWGSKTISLNTALTNTIISFEVHQTWIFLKTDFGPQITFKIVLWEDRSLPAMNSQLYKNHVLAKQIHSSRQSCCCVPTSYLHMHFLSLFVMCYTCKCFMAWKVGSAATAKVKTFTDMVLGPL